jgi:UDP-N-acetyl-D-galactosamine dehydrogenase
MKNKIKGIHASHSRTISVTGLGYVGLGIAVAFGQNDKVIAFDTDKNRIDELKLGIDRNHEIKKNKLQAIGMHYTQNSEDLQAADFHIITVPTPIDITTRLPNFNILHKATQTVGKHLKVGDIVVYESSVYPGVTEEQCVPLLEQSSGLQCVKDFSVGYSPERINPGDKQHTFYNIPKIISATDPSTLEIMATVYNSVVEAGVYPVSSIRVAEATKVIENTQRDLNIACVNEIAIILHELGISVSEVLAAARTKWNYLPFSPGFVGGHCIGFNTYYLTFKAQACGYYPELLLSGRRVNEHMPQFIAEQTMKQLVHKGVSLKGTRVAVLGLTYKENCPDLRDTMVVKLIEALQAYDLEVLIHDPIADKTLAKELYGLELTKWEHLTNIKGVVLAVAHQQYLDPSFTTGNIKAILKPNSVLIDVKGILKPKDFEEAGITVWNF